MDINNIKALSDILVQNGLTAIEISEGDTKIRLERNPASQNLIKPSEAVPLPDYSSAESKKETEPVDFNKIIEVRSPVVGVFYTAPSPESEPFVTIGSKVKKGDVLCIIEAMKLMNEITAEADGEIIDICLKNGDIAEYGQVLFKMF